MTPLLTSALLPYGSAYAIEPGAARQIKAFLRGVDMGAHIRDFRARQEVLQQEAARGSTGQGNDDGDDGDPGYEMNGSVAMLSLSGPLTKQVSSLSGLFGGTSTEDFSEALTAAGSDDTASCILIVADSPGGSVDGTAEAYAVVRDVAAIKPVYVYVPDLCASAGYWISCGASAIYAGTNALIGSIGCYTIVEDTSKAAEAAGVEVVVIGDGEMKGAGADGTPLTDAQKADILRVVSDRNAHFVQAVSQGRKMPIAEARAVADGRVHVGAKAQPLGLIDGVCRLSDLVAKLQANPGSMIPDRQVHPNARPGNTNAAGSRRASPQEKQMKALLAAALATLGMTHMAGKAMAAPDNDPQALANLMASETQAEVDTQVKARMESHPLLFALTAAGITKPDDLAALQADARLGQQSKLAAEASAKAVREEAAKNAIIAYGQKDGAQEAETLAALPVGLALDRYAARIKADADKIAPPQGKRPQTAVATHTAIPREALNADAPQTGPTAASVTDNYLKSNYAVPGAKS